MRTEVKLCLTIGSFFWILWLITPRTQESFLLIFGGLAFFVMAVKMLRSSH